MGRATGGRWPWRQPRRVQHFPCLPVVEQAILAAQPRPSITNYGQASLAVSSAGYQVLASRKTPQQAFAVMTTRLTQISRDR